MVGEGLKDVELLMMDLDVFKEGVEEFAVLNYLYVLALFYNVNFYLLLLSQFVFECFLEYNFVVFIKNPEINKLVPF